MPLVHVPIGSPCTRGSGVADRLEDPDCVARPLGQAGPVALPDPTGADARVLLSWIWSRAWLDLLERSVERTAPTSVQLVCELPRRWWQREGPPTAETDAPRESA